MNSIWKINNWIQFSNWIEMKRIVFKSIETKKNLIWKMIVKYDEGIAKKPRKEDEIAKIVRGQKATLMPL